MKWAHWSDIKADLPLFHAISPMATKDGYLVQYLPQYRAQVWVALAQLPNMHTTRPPNLATRSTTVPPTPIPLTLAPQQ